MDNLKWKREFTSTSHLFKWINSLFFQTNSYSVKVTKALTLLITASLASISRILNQIPIFSALSATARRVSQTNFWASSLTNWRNNFLRFSISFYLYLISTQLFRRANKGASGKAATKMVMKPNWRTEKTYYGKQQMYFVIFCLNVCHFLYSE